MKPVGSKGSSCCSEVVEWGRVGRSEVTRQRGESWARMWKRWCGWVWRSETTRPQEMHSVMCLPADVVVDRPCEAPQYGHFMLVRCDCGFTVSLWVVFFLQESIYSFLG
ncbi:hypothetical protein Hanom_Chr09g00855361 [Helianthus anomalus]